jgi:hypothetical protein
MSAQETTIARLRPMCLMAGQPANSSDEVGGRGVLALRVNTPMKEFGEWWRYNAGRYGIRF